MLVTSFPRIYSFTCVPNIDLKLVDALYVLLTIELEFKVTLIRPEQSRKALSPMLETLFGIVILFRLEQPAKA